MDDAGANPRVGAVVGSLAPPPRSWETNHTYVGRKGRVRKALVEEVEVCRNLSDDLPNREHFEDHLNRSVGGNVNSYFRPGEGPCSR